jgi:hypothetical protein
VGERSVVRRILSISAREIFNVQRWTLDSWFQRLAIAMPHFYLTCNPQRGLGGRATRWDGSSNDEAHELHPSIPGFLGRGDDRADRTGK